MQGLKLLETPEYKLESIAATQSVFCRILPVIICNVTLCGQQKAFADPSNTKLRLHKIKTHR